MKKTVKIPVMLVPSKVGGYVIYSPLTNSVTQGEDVDEALYMIRDCLSLEYDHNPYDSRFWSIEDDEDYVGEPIAREIDIEVDVDDDGKINGIDFKEEQYRSVEEQQRINKRLKEESEDTE